MEIIILVSLNVLFLILLTFNLVLGRKIERMKCVYDRFCTRMQRRLSRLDGEVISLRHSMDEMIEPPSDELTADEERLKARLAEKRFTEGIASILSYGLDQPKTGKEEKQ